MDIEGKESKYSELSKCAEIFREPQGTLVYVCLYCSKQLSRAQGIELHLLDHFAHFELNLVNVDKNEKITDLLDTVFLDPDKIEISDDDSVESMRQQKESIKNSSFKEDYNSDGNNEDEVENKDNNDYKNEDDHNDVRGDDDDDGGDDDIDDDANIGIDCIKCKKTFQCSGLRDQHNYAKHRTSKPPYNCNICNTGFNSKTTTRRHQDLHKTLNVPKCNHCERVFEFQSQLDSHLSKRSVIPKKEFIHVPIIEYKPFKCKLCGNGFQRKNNLKLHMRRHTTDRPYKCDMCNFTATERTNLIVHMRVHTKERPYSCQICDKSFSQSAYVKIHMRIHNGDKSYQCTECGLSFYSTGLMNRHIKIKHSGAPLKTHPCPECGQKFRGPHDLKIHMRSHTGEKPCACEICGATFVSNKTLIQHRHIHTGEKRFKCKYCGMGFVQSAGRRGHEKRVHENI